MWFFGLILKVRGGKIRTRPWTLFRSKQRGIYPERLNNLGLEVCLLVSDSQNFHKPV